MPARVRPLGDDRFAVSFTVSGAVRDKLERARALCSHVVPDGDLAAVFERALDGLIARADTRRHGSARAATTGRDPLIHSDAIPAHVRRAVFERDGGRCTFLGDRGDRCPETRWLEYHHEIARKHGGPPTVDNVSLLCAAHNRHLGERDFPGLAARARVRRAAASRRDDIVAGVVSALRNLGFGVVESRRAADAAWCDDEREPELEAVLRRALRCVGAGGMR